MKVPFGLCCCNQDFCTDCSAAQNINFYEVTARFPTPSRTGFSNATCSGSFNPAAGVTHSWTQFQTVRPDFPQTVRMRKRATGGTIQDWGTNPEFGYGRHSLAGKCQWLWNDPVVFQYTHHDGMYDICDGQPPSVPAHDRPYYPPVIEWTTYVPENPNDSSDPWGRVVLPLSDPRPGTCVVTPSCCETNVIMKWRGFSLIQCSYIHLMYFRGYPPGSILYQPACVPARPYLFYPSAETSHPFYWVMTVRQTVQRAYIVNTHAVLSNGVTLLGGSVLTPGAGGIPAAECGGWDNAYRQQSQQWVIPLGAQIADNHLQYVKMVNCERDFDGNPVVLDFDYSRSECAIGGQFHMASAPSTMEIEFNAL